MRPGVIGGANWGGGAFDPATGMLYVKSSSNTPAILRLAEPDRSPRTRARTKWTPTTSIAGRAPRS